MKNLDFLPPELLRQQEVRTLRWWWIGVCVAFGLFIGTAATLQFLRHREVQGELVRIQPLCEAAKSHERLIADLRMQLQQQYDIADLYAFLEHPWPRSRILADLIVPLPGSLRITELNIDQQQLTTHGRTTAAVTQVIVSEADKPQLPPAIEDFETLWNRSSQLRTVVQIKGLTADAFQLHQYVGQLTDASLVESAKLEALEAVTGESRELSFTLLVVVRPAYSLPGGPAQKTEDGQQTVPAEQAVAATEGVK